MDTLTVFKMVLF